MSDRRTAAVVLLVGVVIVVSLVWAMGRENTRRANVSNVARVCGVPVSLFRQPARALGDDAAARAVRSDPSRHGSAVFSQWRVHEAPDTRIYVGGEPPNVHVTALRREGGTWRWSSGGGCTTFVERPGRAAAFWAISPDGIDRASTQLRVVVSDRQCAGGVSAEERVGPARVRETDTTVVVSFTAEELRGNQGCPGHGSATRVVELQRPLGERVLLDGGIYPPQPACVLSGSPLQPEYCNSLRS